MYEKMIFYDPTCNEHYTLTEDGLRETVDIWQDREEQERMLKEINEELYEKFFKDRAYVDGAEVWRYVLKRLGFGEDVIDRWYI